MTAETEIRITEDRDFDEGEVIALYRANHWSAADKPELLIKALRNSHSLISAYRGNQMIGLGNAISDGYLVVYYPHLLIHPDYQGRGVGRLIMQRFQDKYGGFHQQMLVADGDAITFYRKCGFERAGRTESMWIYQGDEH